MVVLLRAVNVGGQGKLPMAELRRVAVGCGFAQVRTYIQSGNLVCSTPEADSAAVAATLERAIAAETAVSPRVTARTRDELAAVIEANPFRARGEGPSSLHVTFLGDTDEASLGGLDLDAYLPEEAVAIGREVHMFLPDGIGRSRLAADLSRRTTGPGATTRNWRTVTKLLAMADEAA